MEMPVFQCRQAPVVNIGAKTLQDSLVHDFAAFIDRDFDYFVAGRSGQLPWIDNGIEGRDRESWANLVAVQVALIQGSVRKPGLSSMPHRGQSLSLGVILILSLNIGGPR